ncbi:MULTISPECIES: DUF4893 domain-containing protein [Muribaculaceae]|nr:MULTISPECIES: DUF4893 domain-containing protein [Muribaculaceae]ROT04499.1 DUF4893 domain-containing protein [Muribaculaceae bacterium Isolate-100 (HZI)]RXE64224.1 DUF4893 domain-containing protein [Muribaculaceae bacterium Isolate-007 (NCI)]TGX79581.1 DUF4893 domain-containing protein [Muribaculum intestinale]
MSSIKYIATLIAISGFLTAFADTDNLTGAWKGPKDLMVNICIDNDKQLYVGYCGILRTYGWVDFSTSLTPDSLIIKSADIGSPFEGRFKIESDNRLVGKLEMGSHGDDWYFNGNAELVKEKPVMPENLNPELEDIILPSDYGVLARDRNIAWEALSTLTPESYGYAEKNMVEKLVNAKTYPITPKDMIGFRRVRSIQIDARDGIFSYPYFNCRFKKADGKVFFEKTTGSQRKSGYVYQNSPESLVFLGGWSVNDDPQTGYGSTNSVVGKVYKIGPRKAIMIFPTEEDRVEIYELTK